MIWFGMRLPKGLKLSALVALAVPALVGLTAVTTLADSSPSRTALPGDPARGATLFGQNCATCHGSSLAGGIGPSLNPIEKLPGISNPLDQTFLIDIITNGRKPQAPAPGATDMPPKGGNAGLTDKDVNVLAAFIIVQTMTGSPPLAPGELAK